MRVRATERRQQLIDATVELLSREGVDRATLRAFSAEAKAPLAAVHYCFGSKDELMQAAVEHWLHQLVDAMGEDAPVEGGLRAVVTKLAERFWLSLESNPSSLLAQLELTIWAIRNDGGSQLAPSSYQLYEEALGDLFAQALARGGEQSRIPVGQLARAFVGIIDAASLQFLADPESTAGHELYDLMLDAVLMSAGV